MSQSVFPPSDLPILTTLKEIGALFDRAGSFVEDAPDRVHLLAVDMPRDMGSFSELANFAGPRGAVHELVARLWPTLSGPDPVHALILPDGRVVLTAHPDNRSDDLFRLALVSSDSKATAAEIDAIVQVLIGVNALHDTNRKAAPLATAEDWDPTLRKMLTRKQIETRFDAVTGASGKRPVPARRTSVVDDHLRWFAREMLRAPVARPRVVRQAAPAYQPADPRDHIVNMRFGRLSAQGYVSTSPADLQDIARRARAFVDATGGEIVVYAHGGLNPEQRAVNYAGDTVDWWLWHNVFPIYCVWETDALSSVLLALRGVMGEAGRGVWSDLRDTTTEAVVRAGGQPVWNAMKVSAMIGSQPDGGMTLLAQALDEAFGSRPLPLHLVGHSAGAILHLHWLPVLRAAGRVPVSFQTLAPAATTQFARKAFGPPAEAASTRCRVYTLTDPAERADTVGPFYGKSQLYLVARAYEPEGPVPLTGLQRDLMADHALLDLLTAGNGGSLRETVVQASSKIAPGTERLASTAKTHGDFDNDPATMHSALMFIRPDLAFSALKTFPARVRSRSGDDLLPVLPPEVQTYLSLTSRTMPQTAPRPSRADPSPASPRSGALRLLTIGIDLYPDQPLQGCVNDSNLWADWFQSRDLECRQHVTPQDTTRDHIARHLSDFVTTARPDDTLVWHFSGHGAHYKDTADDLGDEHSDRDQAIVGYYETRTPTLVEHALIDDEIHSILQKLTPGAELLIFLDSCFSGSATRFAESGRVRSLGGFVRPGYRARGRPLTGGGTTRSGSNPYSGSNHVLFAAADTSQKAQEQTVNGTQFGRFTHAVHSLLPDLQRGITNARFLADVSSIASLMNQHPQIYCDPVRTGQPFALAGL